MWTLAARALLVDAGRWCEGGGLVFEGGRVRRVLSSRRAVLRQGGRRLELEGLWITPGLVNAHAHLDLSALGGKVSARGDFSAWLRRVIRSRARLEEREVELGVLAGARALIASGTTSVGDIDASGASTRLGARLGLRGVIYREVLDAHDPTRTDAVLRRLARGPAAPGAFGPGLAPHAPYTTSPALLAGVRSVAERRGLPLAIHWAETREEEAWLARGSGPFRSFLGRSPRRSGLELLDAAGLLGPRTTLVHGNHPGRKDEQLLARRGVTLVHCPGTHRFFARAPFPLRRFQAAGVPLALGTDSLASNTALDLRREMALLRAAHPRLAPADVFTMATRGGARALARDDLGHLRPGAAADVAAWRLDACRLEEALDELTSACPPLEACWIGSRRAF